MRGCLSSVAERAGMRSAWGIKSEAESRSHLRTAGQSRRQPWT